jgi:hypothetical protein
VNPVSPVPGQLVVGAAALGLLCLLMVAIALVIVICARWTRARSADEHEAGPDALRLLEELDLHLDAYLLENPEVREGFDRLRDAVGDEQQGEAS